MAKIHWLEAPETRSIVGLGAGLSLIAGAVCVIASSYAPDAGWQLLGLFILAVLAIWRTCWLWLRQLQQRFAAIMQQLADAMKDKPDYQMALNDEGLFSDLHNQLFQYVRRTTALRADLERDRAQLSRAITDIAHQLRTPIAASDNLLELLDEANAAKTRDALLAQNQRLAALVTQMILLARVDTHTLSQEKTSQPLNGLVRGAVNLLLNPLADRDLQLDWQIEDSLLVNVNAQLTREALINVLKNSLEHAAPHSTLTLHATATPIATRLTVTNQGPVIPEAELPHLFERFYRGSQTGPNNLGIGLAIAQGIIAASDGRLTIANVTGGVQYQIEWFK
ncbi:sensor histidine kinase [Lacticaseibacillus yichunensis]|uniref:histidine kinase n=1 Tax=Lacticaseibacillus yichunensis TaxID=2486015 RepID=A0ABW4CQ66_9LACO|nr:HAMP domain-containing sensor histidine kinase [Lacticaseibacillus yichunensis]